MVKIKAEAHWRLKKLFFLKLNSLVEMHIYEYFT